MPHLSDGELHAYLDGALEHLPGGRAEEIREHLRTCEACRSHLAAERELLERSGAILDAGAPAPVEAPPLEELRERARIREARAEEERGRRWRPMPGTQVLAWAATVVLALGIGWITRDLTGVRSPLGSPVESVDAPAEVEVPEAGRPAAGGADGTDTGPRADIRSRDEARGFADAPLAGEAADEAAGGDRTGGAGAAEPVEPAEEPVRRTAEADAGAAGPPADAAGPPGEAEGTPPASASELARPERAAARPSGEREEVAPPVPGAVVGRVVDEASLAPLRGAAVVLVDSAGVHHGGTLTDSDGRFVVRADSPGVYRAVAELLGYGRTGTDLFELSSDETVAHEIRVSAQAVGLDAITVTGVTSEEEKAAEGAGGVPVPESAAAALSALRAPAVREGARMQAGDASEGIAPSALASILVPDLPVVRVTGQEGPPGFLIGQRLPGGETLLLRWIAGAAVDEGSVGEVSFPDPLPEGWSQVALRRPDGWLVARAPLPEAELRALLSRPR